MLDIDLKSMLIIVNIIWKNHHPGNGSMSQRNSLELQQNSSSNTRIEFNDKMCNTIYRGNPYLKFLMLYEELGMGSRYTSPVCHDSILQGYGGSVIKLILEKKIYPLFQYFSLLEKLRNQLTVTFFSNILVNLAV